MNRQIIITQPASVGYGTSKNQKQIGQIVIKEEEKVHNNDASNYFDQQIDSVKLDNRMYSATDRLSSISEMHWPSMKFGD